ncbi:MAG: sugar ABC transporter permease [Treponema sp.]|jgi:ABC-type sugar transport system permease subunit|nr:sugar ABC transporter permease [Treponema sp.]
MDMGKITARNRIRGQKIRPYIYIMPAIVFLLLFTVYPILRQGYLSFFNTDALISFMEYTGLRHYRDMVSNPVFREVVKNTLVYGILQVSLTLVLGLGCALIANSKLNRFGSLFKVSMFYPYILPWAVAAMVWMYIFHPTRGIVNALSGRRIQWLNDFHLTLYVLVFISVWKTVGFNFLLFLSGLQSIPQVLYEAIRLETNSWFKAFRYVTLPMISPTAFAAVLLSIVGSFQSVDLIYIVTQGRPGNSTNVLIYYIYQQGITNWNIGYGSALSSVLFIALLFFTIIYIVLGEKKVQYDR